jgi:hypothetical protein
MTRAWLLVLAACYSPHADTGSPCSPSAPACPGDQVCVASGSGTFCQLPGLLPQDAGIDMELADAPIDGSPLTDRDGDGIVDSDDNCRDVANADQHDEDGDTVGDACDPCPPSPTNTDADGDGVGDDCDPNPSIAGERILLFEGFGSGVPAMWNTGGPPWTASDDDAVVTSSGPVATATFPALGDHEAIIAGVTITSVTGTGYREAGVEDNVGGGYADVCAALITGAGDTTPNEPLIDLFRMPSGSAIDRSGFGWNVGDDMYIAESRTGTTYNCYGYDFVSMQEAGAGGTDTTLTPNPRAGLRVVSATARYHWVLVIGL